MIAQREAAQEAVLERLIHSLEECQHRREFSPGYLSSCGKCERCRLSEELIDKWAEHGSSYYQIHWVIFNRAPPERG